MGPINGNAAVFLLPPERVRLMYASGIQIEKVEVDEVTVGDLTEYPLQLRPRQHGTARADVIASGAMVTVSTGFPLTRMPTGLCLPIYKY